MSVGDTRFGIKVSFEKLNATEKAGDRLELARLLLDCLFSKEEQGSISFHSLDPMKLSALRSNDMYTVDEVDFNIAFISVVHCILMFPLKEGETSKETTQRINRVLSDKCRYQERRLPSSGLW